MSTQANVTSAGRATKSRLAALSRAALLAMLAATASNFVLYFAAGALFPEVTAWPGSGPGQIVGATVAYLLIGTIAFAVVARLSTQPARHYQILATIGLLLSLGLPISAGFGYGPPGTPAAGAVTVVTLCLMHVASYAISVPLFLRTLVD